MATSMRLMSLNLVESLMVPDDIQVIVPYKTLVSLLEAATRQDEFARKLKQLDGQINALRGQFFEYVTQSADSKKMTVVR